MKKTLLLDIDYTTFHEQTPRPFLKDFIERMSEKYDIGFYTAADSMRVQDACRILYHNLRMPDDVVHQIQRQSLSRETCPLISYPLPNLGGYIDVKCLQKAADKLGVPLAAILLLDDAPMHDNPNRDQRIQAPGFCGQLDDNYLQSLDI